MTPDPRSIQGQILALIRDGVDSVPELRRRSRFTTATIHEAIKALARERRIAVVGWSYARLLPADAVPVPVQRIVAPSPKPKPAPKPTRVIHGVVYEVTFSGRESLLGWQPGRASSLCGALERASE